MATEQSNHTAPSRQMDAAVEKAHGWKSANRGYRWILPTGGKSVLIRRKRQAGSKLMAYSQTEIIEREIMILRVLLCGPLSGGSMRESAKRVLANYHWRQPLHQALFEAILSIPTDDPEIIHIQLPARLTRRGFPDFELGDFFRPALLSREDAESLMRRMADEAGEAPGAKEG